MNNKKDHANSWSIRSLCNFGIIAYVSVLGWPEARGRNTFHKIRNIALALLDVAIYRRKQEPRTGLRSPDRAMGDGEEEIREDGENGKGETHQRLQPALLLAGGLQLVAGDGNGGACVRPWSARELCVAGGD